MKNYPTMKDINRKVVITVDKNVTLARIFDDNKVVAKGVAKFSPEDTFDFQMGAELAMKRAFESVPKKEQKKQEWRVVNRKPKAGDYVRIVKSMYFFDEYKPIVKVHDVDGLVRVKNEDHPTAKSAYLGSPIVTDTFIWNYWPSEVEVVEPVVEPTNKYRKLNRLPRKGNYARVLTSWYDFNNPDTYLRVHDVFY